MIKLSHSLQKSDSGEYVCTIKLNNHTRSDSVVVTVASLAVQVSVVLLNNSNLSKFSYPN